MTLPSRGLGRKLTFRGDTERVTGSSEVKPNEIERSWRPSWSHGGHLGRHFVTSLGLNRRLYYFPIQNDVFVENNVSVPGIDDVHVSDEKVSNDDSSTKHSESLTGEEETINYSEKAPDENCTVDRFTSIKGKHKEDAILVPDENSPVKAKVGDNNSKNKRIWRNLPNKKFFLSFSDKNDIRYDKKLNSDIINFSLGLLSSQFPDR